MNIWFMLWVFVATFILGMSLWSFVILLRQKRAWQTLAQKQNLDFIAVALLKSPMLRGSYNGIKCVVYSDPQMAGKGREGGDVRTTFLFTLKAPMPTEGAIGSVAFKKFILGLSLPEEYVPEGGELHKDIFNRVESKEAISSYFTKERVDSLNAVMTIKGSPALLIFSKEDTILRIESPDPFIDPLRLERFLNKASDAARILSC